MLAVEHFFRQKPFKKILSIAWKKVWPNSKVTTTDSLEVIRWGRNRVLAERLWNKFQFLEWEGERYDKRIILALSDSEASFEIKVRGSNNYNIIMPHFL